MKIRERGSLLGWTWSPDTVFQFTASAAQRKESPAGSDDLKTAFARMHKEEYDVVSGPSAYSSYERFLYEAPKVMSPPWWAGEELI